MGTNRGEITLPKSYPVVPWIIAMYFADMEQLGLAAVPLLPYMFDKPVEEAVEWSFHNAFHMIGGPEAVGKSPTTGREEQLATAMKKKSKPKEKEL